MSDMLNFNECPEVIDDLPFDLDPPNADKRAQLKKKA